MNPLKIYEEEKEREEKAILTSVGEEAFNSVH